MNNEAYYSKDLITFVLDHIRSGDESKAMYIFLITKTMVKGVDREKLGQM